MAAELVKINRLPNPNKTLILDFLENYRFKKKQLSIARKSRLASQLHFFSTLFEKPLKPFQESETNELVKLIERYENKHKVYSLHTWREMVKNIKIWIKWTNPDRYPTILLNCKDAITVQNPYSDPKRKAKLDEFLITDETFSKLLNAGNTQHKALLAVGFGCGPRSGELLGLRRKNLEFNSDGTVAASFLESKTFPRENVLLTPDLAYYVREWYEKSPANNPMTFSFVPPMDPQNQSATNYSTSPSND
ncbi:MAG: hypothetical protein J4215_02440 [Candidatus Diapherotrites archaeon]|uniref:Tyr recombinase domain-containing protein n=1 Tax=Candidatus Iainarchaeum sp. TaxID=3101447 RepID=A0A8T4L7B7_9ARCH|nr:hypothetical protein [Candidatus Diapherotrites archaeon]